MERTVNNLLHRYSDAILITVFMIGAMVNTMVSFQLLNYGSWFYSLLTQIMILALLSRNGNHNSDHAFLITWIFALWGITLLLPALMCLR